jgi:hypothetical protein
MSTSAMLDSTCSGRSSPANDEGMLSLAALDLVQRTDCVAIVVAGSDKAVLACVSNSTALGVRLIRSQRTEVRLRPRCSRFPAWAIVA